MSSKSNSNLTNASPNPKLQYRLSNGRLNPGLIFLNRHSLFNHFLTSRHNKTDNFCLYLHRFCLQNRLDGYNYCIRHILYDRNAPFKQCSYTHPQTNKRCPNAARRFDRRDITYCPWHIKKFNLQKRKTEQLQYAKDLEDSSNPESIKRKFEELEHYCPSNEHDHRRKNVNWELPDDKCVTSSKALKVKINDSINWSQCHSSNEDEFNNTTLAEVLNLDHVDSDNDSVESYMDDPLRHAGVYTAEEIAHILRDKMLRLQTLYINLLNYYRHILKNKMRQYSLNIKNEKPPEKNSIAEVTDNMKEDEDYKTLKAMHKYHNIWGVEKVVKDAACEIRRSLVEGSETKSPSHPTCIYAKDSDVCTQRCVPLSNYCRNHILYDPQQVLYRPCAGGSPPCLNPVISYVHKNNCVRHVQVKFDKSEIANILSPTKEEVHDTNTSMSELVHEPELFQSMDDIALGIDPVVPGNLFGLEQFDLENTDILS